MQFAYDKESYKFYKQEAEDDCVFLVNRKVEDNDGYNGLTVAYQMATQGPECRMVNVCVSYCAPEDEFKGKRGKYQALMKFYTGQTIVLPLGLAMQAWGPGSVGEFLLDMFEI